LKSLNLSKMLPFTVNNIVQSVSPFATSHDFSVIASVFDLNHALDALHLT
jgi:hypothetical protein